MDESASKSPWPQESERARLEERECGRRRRSQSRKPCPSSQARLRSQPGYNRRCIWGRDLDENRVFVFLWEGSMSWITSSRTLTGAKSKIAPLFNLTTMELSCMGGGRVNLSSIVHSSLLNSALASSKSSSTFSTALGPSLAAPARTLFLTWRLRSRFGIEQDANVAQEIVFFFIGPKSDHWQCLLLTDSLPFSKLDWCDPGVRIWLLKNCWGCYTCWC